MNELQPVRKPGVKVPKFGPGEVPKHVAIVMDGNGRWANAQGLTRIEGHKAGEVALLDVVAGAIEAGVKYLTVFAFSTENWKRSPEEVRFLMGYNVEVLRRRRDQLNAWGVRIRWAGRRPKLWGSVIRIEMVDAMKKLSQDVADGKLQPGKITEKTITQYLNSSFLPDVDLFLRSSGEQRISNFLLWQSAYAELVFDETPWPAFNRQELWKAISAFTARSRRFGAAVDKPQRERSAR
jgi:undecaprenyl diphosphate synthase